MPRHLLQRAGGLLWAAAVALAVPDWDGTLVDEDGSDNPAPKKPNHSPGEIVHHPKDHVPEIAGALVVLAALVAACVVMAKRRKSDPLQDSLNAPLNRDGLGGGRA